MVDRLSPRAFPLPGWLQWVALLIVLLAALLLLRQDNCSATGQTCFTLFQLTLNGLLTGGVYALVALGIVIINKASGVFNFAHGYMMLVGAMLFWQGFNAIPSWQFSAILGVIAALVTVALIGSSPNISDALAKASWAERWRLRLTDGRFLLAIAAGAAVGGVMYLLLQNLDDAIIRGAIAAVVGSAGIGLAVERFTIRPLLGQPILAAIMMTLAVGLVLQGIGSLIWGTQPLDLSIFTEPPTETVVPAGVDAESGQIIYIKSSVPGRALPNFRLDTTDLLGRDLSFSRNLVWGFLIAIICFIGFVVFFQFTSTGLAMRAVAENQTLAESVGLRVRTILAVAWAIATTMAMIAGVIQGTGPGVGVSSLVIPSLAFRAFPAVLLGGLESITGALVGGLLIGVVEVLASNLIDSTTGQEFAPFFVLLIVLMIRPDGLFGQRRIDRV